MTAAAVSLTALSLVSRAMRCQEEGPEAGRTGKKRGPRLVLALRPPHGSPLYTPFLCLTGMGRVRPCVGIRKGVSRVVPHMGCS